MKRIFAFVFSLILLFCFPINSFSSGKMTVSAKAAVLICADNGEVVFEKNAHEKLSMASTTKIMTALITIEQCCPERVVVVSENAIKVEGTSMGLKKGDKVNYYSLVCGMLLSSGNDAANVAATDISGSIEEFAVLMNERAKKLGMNDTSFVTPSGLDAKDHYSTAYDMALLSSFAIKNETFREICSSKSKTVSFGNPETEHTLYNHNKLLGSVEGVFGVKTGFTKKSGRCLVSACERNGITLICVTLNDPDDWADHKKLFDYGFERCVLPDCDLTEVGVRVTGGERKIVDVECACLPVLVNKGNEFTRLVTVDSFLYAPVKSGQKVGAVYYYSKDGKLLYTVDLLSVQSVNAVKAVKVQKNQQEKKKSIFDFLKSIFRR